jgi:hypothetical protein
MNNSGDVGNKLDLINEEIVKLPSRWKSDSSRTPQRNGRTGYGWRV